MGTPTVFLLLIIFVLFVLSMKKVFSIVLNAVWISIAAILFPILMNRFLGFDIPIDRDSLISFVLLGLTVYFIYLIGKSIYRMLKVTEGVAKKVMPKMEKKEKKEKEDKYEHDDIKGREKELRKKEKELQKRGQEIRWKTAIETNKTKKKPYDDEKDYVVLKNAEKKKSLIEPLPVIDHKKKKRKDD